MGLKDDVYMEEAYKLLLATLSRGPLVEEHFCSMVECEMRKKDKSLQQRLWCMNMKLTPNEDCLGQGHALLGSRQRACESNETMETVESNETVESMESIDQIYETKPWPDWDAGKEDIKCVGDSRDVDAAASKCNVGALISKVALFLLYPRIHGVELFAWTATVASQLAREKDSSPAHLVKLLNGAYEILKQHEKKSQGSCLKLKLLQ